MSFPTTISWPESWGIDPDGFDSPDNLIQALDDKFGEMKDAYFQAFAEHNQKLPRLLSLMTMESWYP